jgi:hypothetical protein
VPGSRIHPEALGVDPIRHDREQAPGHDSLTNETVSGSLADDRHMIHQTIAETISRHEERTALIDIVDRGDQRRHRSQQSNHPGHEIRVHHVTVHHIRFPPADQTGHPEESARIRHTPGHFQALDRESALTSLLPHRAERRQ